MSDWVDAERVAGTRAERAAEFVGEIQVLHVGPGETEHFHHERRRDSDDHQKDDHQQRDDRDTIAAKAPPEQLQRRARGDFSARLQEPEPAAGAGNDLCSANAHRATAPRQGAASVGGALIAATEPPQQVLIVTM